MEAHSELTKKILKKVRQIEIKTNRMVTDAMAGAYHSIFKGQGMDFEEVREYTPGDDVRSIDWNVTAKMDRPFIKKFREERELTIMLLIDLSASGNFGSVLESKREIAAELGSLLAFSATKNNDKVGLILFTDKIETFIPPKKGRFHVLRLIREILFFKPQNKGTNINLALDYFNSVINKKSVVFLISDFLQNKNDLLDLKFNHNLREDLIKNLEMTKKRHDLICVTLTDPRELQLTPVGIITLEDSETGEQIEIDTYSKELRSLYELENRKRLNTFQATLTQKGIDTLAISTDKSYVTPLRNFLHKRLKKRQR
ncbi:MAG: DUF58 domain-containing protein [Verrucomicrobia bacterium]|nr:MAG: DUF58 domain-containing protein [Verrucomicrobiota bacterium]